MNPHLILGALLAAAACAVSGWIGGAHHEAQQDQLRRDAELQAAHERYVADDKRLAAVAGDLEAVKAARKVTYAKLDQQAEAVAARPDMQRDCLDADSVRLANAYLVGAPADPAIAASAVPAADASGGRDGR